jgi:N-acetylglucosamine-6-sulfatase
MRIRFVARGCTVLAALAAVALLFALPGAAAAKPPRPNVVFVMTDDQDWHSMWAMRKTRQLIGGRGTTFDHSFISFSLCCPSRATLLTGQYAHNHSVKWNNWPLGGFRKLRGAQTLPVWLERAGYFTAHIGKYLNEYGEDGPTVVPPGWTDWYGAVDPTTYDYYGFTINHNGRLKMYPRTPRFYSTDVYTELAEDVIRAGHRSGKPFFLSLAPNAPHTVARANDARMEGTPAIPPPRYANRFASPHLPRYPNFNEEDVSDKPPLIQQVFPSLTDDDVDALTAHYRGRMGSLLGVDDMVADVVRTLKRTGEYDNTVIVYTSDNGWILGEHRLRDPVTEDGRAAGVKYLPYEGSTRVPLMIAGPGIPHRTVHGVTINPDWAATIADLTGARPALPGDGRSLLPVTSHPNALDDRAVLFETFPNPRAPAYKGVRTARYLYTVQDDGEGEQLYDYAVDPWELSSKQADPAYTRVKVALIGALNRLEDCKGRSCEVKVRVPRPG